MGEHNCYRGDVQECIQKKAYELWKHDGCKPGRDQDYWLMAEKTVNAPIKNNNPRHQK
ncbi:MAG: DUF2934 domain-containing protein [Candidatus Omnitrophica bacterium]|nr:DUF2934 domain-containing protein [Candidatus Omnitrophota bacterium]